MSRRAKVLVAVSFAITVIAILAAVWQGVREGPTPPRPVTRFALVFPPDVSFLTGQNVPVMALSPDGNRLMYAARVGSGNPQIYSRAIDQLDATPIRGTEGARFPFFSPDGQWIGFNSLDGKLKKVPVGGGPVVTLCDVGFVAGAAWLSDDSIVFRPNAGVGLLRVSAAGGKPQEFLKPDGKSEISLRWPEVLPGGKAIVFSIEKSNADFNSEEIGALRLDTGERRVLVEGGMHPHYISSGHLVFARGGEILAVPFDPRTLQVNGSPVPVIEGVLTSTALASAQFTVSSLGGSIAYMPGSAAQDRSTLVWIDRHGATQPVAAPKRNYEFPRLSPDGQQMAVRINGGSDPGQDIWLYQFARGTLSRFTSKANDAETPVWTPDGKRVAFAMTSSNPARQILWKLADGSAGEELLAGSDRHLHLGGWSPKGDALVAMATDTGNIWTLEMADKRTLRPFLQAPYQTRDDLARRAVAGLCSERHKPV